MAGSTRPDAASESLTLETAVSDAEWLTISLTLGGIVCSAYLLTHPYPAYEGGLFLQMAEEIAAHGYGIPERIPYYSEGGVPFAYPPAIFFVVALLVEELGVRPIAVTRFLPTVLVLASLVAFYYASKELVRSRRVAGIATTLFVVTPGVLRWHLSAGGVVRGTGLLVALVGVYAGCKLFETGARRWLVASTVLFGLEVLTHPTYAAFFGLSFLLLFAFLDRSPRGLARGAVVALGGVALAGPWWLQVVGHHGADIYLGAAGTHSGLGGGLTRVYTTLVVPVQRFDVLSPFYVLTYAGVGYLLVRGRYLLPTWALTSTYVIGKHRFLFVAGSMAAATLVGVALDRTSLRRRAPRWRTSATDVASTLTVLVVLVLLLSAAGVGVLFVSSQLDTVPRESASMPQTLTAEDRAAMRWARTNTAPDDEFVVLGDRAEWFPYFADRTILVSWWGSEWTGTESFYEEVSLYKRISRCTSATCLSGELAAAGREPEYVYVNRHTYTVRGKEFREAEQLHRSLRASPRYVSAYRNDDVVVYRVTDSPVRTSAVRTAVSSPPVR